MGFLDDFFGEEYYDDERGYDEYVNENNDEDAGGARVSVPDDYPPFPLARPLPASDIAKLRESEDRALAAIDASKLLINKLFAAYKDIQPDEYAKLLAEQGRLSEAGFVIPDDLLLDNEVRRHAHDEDEKLKLFTQLHGSRDNMLEWLSKPGNFELARDDVESLNRIDREVRQELLYLTSTDDYGFENMSMKMISNFLSGSLIILLLILISGILTCTFIKNIYKRCVLPNWHDSKFLRMFCFLSGCWALAVIGYAFVFDDYYFSNSYHLYPGRLLAVVFLPIIISGALTYIFKKYIISPNDSAELNKESAKADLSAFLNINKAAVLKFAEDMSPEEINEMISYLQKTSEKGA